MKENKIKLNVKKLFPNPIKKDFSTSSIILG
eukprot:UN11172